MHILTDLHCMAFKKSLFSAEEWKTISIAGVGALFLLITMALTAVVCYRRRKRRKGYNHIPGNNTAANVEQPVSHNDSPETDGPSRHKGE